MENSKIKEHVINANTNRLKIISVIVLGFSIFILLTDFMFHEVWQDEHLYFYKILDIVFAIISVSAISFFWGFKKKNIALQKVVTLLFPFLIIIWAAIITGIGYSIFGFSTLIVVALLMASFLYLNIILSIFYFCSAGIALVTTMHLTGDLPDINLPLLIVLIPIITISVIISAKNYKYQINAFSNQEEMVELNKKLNDYNINLEEDIGTRTKEIIAAKEKAEESEIRLAEAQRIAKVGSWYTNFQDGYLEWSKACYSIFEMNENLENEKLRTTLRDKIHHEDLIQLDIISKNANKNIENFKFEYRVLLKNGVKNILLLSEPVLNSENKLIGTKGTIQDVTEQKQAELALIKAKEKAEESDRLKSAFLANLSHEIRTPMNGILGFSKLLKKPNLTSEKQQEFIEIIGKSGTRMLNTINNIVDISKIEAGLMSVNIKESNINEQIEFLHTFFKPEAESKGLQLSINKGLPSNEADIKTDNEKVNAILTILIKNGIKFSVEGSIEFGYQKKGEYLEFFVKDTGIGIPQDRLDAIFERFIQADIEDTQALQGSGLGLTISKSYVEMLNGKMWVESAEGLGSTFYFTIPYNAVLEEINTIKNALPEKDEEVEINPAGSELKILVVEDDEVSALFITETLQEISPEISYASTGMEAIEFCSSNPDLDLILMDIRMPGINGYEATRQIRQFNKDVIIIAQTAHGLTGDKEKAIEAGCNDYISKPIDMTSLIEVAKSIVIDRK